MLGSRDAVRKNLHLRNLHSHWRNRKNTEINTNLCSMNIGSNGYKTNGVIAKG